MCINLSYENKIYLSRMKAKLSRTIDNMNDSIVYAVEEFDKKYIEFGGIVLRKFNNFWNSRHTGSRRYSYTRANSGYMSPTNSNSRISPFEIITTDISSQISEKNFDTHNVVINVEEDDDNSNTNTNSEQNMSILNQRKPQENYQPKSQEMVEKHFIDKTESFLDDAWDIINGND